MAFADRRDQPGDMEEPGLHARDVHVAFGGVKAIDGVDLDLRKGEILGLIGPNGAGKTTLVNVLTGFQRPTAGAVVLAGQDVTGWPPERITRAGLSRTFQNVRLFLRLSAIENVELGGVGVGLGRSEARVVARELLDRLGLGAKEERPASSFSHGDKRRLGIARALAMRPHYVLLDEPGAGLTEIESSNLVASLVEIRRAYSLGMLVIEHDMRFIMNLCDVIQVLDYGRTIALDSPAEIQANRDVRSAYLGVDTDDPHA